MGGLKASTVANMTRRMTSDTESKRWVRDGRGWIGVLHHGGIIITSTSRTPSHMALAILLFLAKVALSQWISYPSSGLASLTHYQLPSGYIAACGCVPGSTNYPTAALSQMAYGSSTSYGTVFYSWLASSASHLLPLGPACGKCFQLTLLNPVIATPPFKPDVTKSIVVKITDLCPFAKGGLCGATAQTPNS